MSLETLYPDLILEISKYLEHSDRKALRLTCIILSRNIAYNVWHKLGIKMSRDSLIPFLDCLSDSAALHAPASAVREITFSGPYEPENEDSEPPSIEESLSDTRMGYLLRLTNVHKIRPHNSGVADRLAAFVSSLPQVKDLNLYLECQSLPSLKGFKNLRRIDYTENAKDSSTAFELGHAIAKSPHLQYLTVSLNGSRDHIEQLFLQCSLKSVHLSYLYSITLRRASAPVLLVPLLKRLKRLDISQHYYSNKPTAEDDKAMDKFWLGLLEQKVSLSRLYIDHVTDGLVEYLAGYSGLRRFRLSRGRSAEGDVTGQMAKRFFDGVLPNHTETLEKLEIYRDLEDNWSWSDENRDSILKCSSLKDLCIGLSYSELHSSFSLIHASHAENHNLITSDPNSLPTKTPISAMLDAILTMCPRIRRLQLISNLDYLEDDDDVLYWEQKDRLSELETVITAYHTPVGVTSPPTIFPKGGGSSYINRFIPVYDEELGRYLYQTRTAFENDS